MCVIVVKNKEVDIPKKEYLKNCFDGNSDGAGLMYTDDGRVIIEKGFMTWEAFEKKFDHLCKKYNNFKDKSLVCHFRIGTQGKNDKFTCHPFPVSSKHNMLRKRKVSTDVGVVHNGIIYDYGKSSNWAKIHPSDSLLSDTQLFIRYCLAPYKSLNREFYKNKMVMEYIERAIDGDKMVFLDKDDNVYMLGKFVEHEGVQYSNTSYEPYVFKYASYNWDNDMNTLNNTTFGYDYDEELGLEGYDYDDVGDYLLTAEKGDILHLVQTGMRYEVEDENTYYIDTYESIIYERDNHNRLVFVDYGYVGGE